MVADMEVKDAIMALERLRHTEAKWPGTEETLEALDMAVAALRLAPSPEQLRGMCWACGHAEPYANRPMYHGIVTCPYMREQGIAARGGRGGKNCPHWTLCQEDRHDLGNVAIDAAKCDIIPALLARAGQTDTPPWAGLIRKRFEQVR